MSDITSFDFRHADLRSRGEVFEALYALSAGLEDLRRRTGYASAVDDAARATATRIGAAVAAGVLADGFEAARVGRVMASALAGGDAALLAERAADEQLFELWLDALRMWPGDQWRTTLTDTFPDMPTLIRPRLDTTTELAFTHRSELLAALEALAIHIHDGEEYEREHGPGTWDRRFLLLSTRIAATLTHHDPQLLTAGEFARAERVFAGLAQFEVIGDPDPQVMMRAITDPEFFHDRWRGPRAAARQDRDLNSQRYRALVAEVHRVRGLPIAARGIVNEHNREFTDAPGLKPVDYFNDDVTYPLMDLPGLEEAVGELVDRAAAGVRAANTAPDGKWTFDIHELAEAAVFTIRAPGRGGLSLHAGLRAERVIASIDALEPATLARTPGRVWQAILEDRFYEQLLDERNSAELARRRDQAGITAPDADYHRWVDNIAAARTRLTAARAASEAGAGKVLSTRAEVIDALHEWSRAVATARRFADADTPAAADGVLPEDVRADVDPIIAALRADIVPDRGERERGITLVVSVLSGGDTALLAERFTDAELFELWQPTAQADPHNNRWRTTPTGTFPDAPGLRRVRIVTHHDQALHDRGALAAAFEALATHIGRGDGRVPFGPGVWERRLRELAIPIAATLDHRDAELLTAGESARAPQVFAGLLNFELIASDSDRVWAAVTDPEHFEHWQRVYAINRAGGLNRQRVIAAVAEVARQRGIPIEDRATVNVHNPEFSDAPGLEPVDYRYSAAVMLTPMTVLDLEQAVHDLAFRAAYGPTPDLLPGVGETDAQWREALRARAIPILDAATDTLAGALPEVAAAQAQRVIAAVVATEPDILERGPDGVWQTIVDETSYNTWLDARNTPILTAHLADAGITDPVAVERYTTNPGGWYDNLERAEVEQLRAELAADLAAGLDSFGDFEDTPSLAPIQITGTPPRLTRIAFDQALESLACQGDTDRAADRIRTGQALATAQQILHHLRDGGRFLAGSNAFAARAERFAAAAVAGEPEALAVENVYELLTDPEPDRTRNRYTHWLKTRNDRIHAEDEQNSRESLAAMSQFYRDNPDLDPEVRYERQQREAADLMEPDWDRLDAECEKLVEAVIADPHPDRLEQALADLKQLRWADTPAEFTGRLARRLHVMTNAEPLGWVAAAEVARVRQAASRSASIATDSDSQALATDIGSDADGLAAAATARPDPNPTSAAPAETPHEPSPDPGADAGAANEAEPPF